MFFGCSGRQPRQGFFGRVDKQNVKLRDCFYFCLKKIFSPSRAVGSVGWIGIFDIEQEAAVCVAQLYGEVGWIQ